MAIHVGKQWLIPEHRIELDLDFQRQSLSEPGFATEYDVEFCAFHIELEAVDRQTLLTLNVVECDGADRAHLPHTEKLRAWGNERRNSSFGG